jgi:hypothetical protein
MHGTATDRLQELERRHRDAMSEFAMHKDKASMTTIDTIERKIQEASKLAEDKFDSLKGLHGQVSMANENLEIKVMSEIKRLADDHRRLGEDHGKKHQNLQEIVGKLQTDQHAKHLDTHTSLTDVVQTLEKRMREAMASLASENEAKHTAHSGNLEAMQRRWREELASTSSEHHATHADHKDHLSKVSRDVQKELSELREHHGRHASSHKALVDDHKIDIRASMQDMDAKLRREMGSLCDELRNQLIEFVAKANQDREMQCGALGGRLDDVDRRLKDMLVRFSADQENTHSTLTGMLNALERKLREEVNGVHDEHHGKNADLKDQVQRGLSDLGTRHTEIKELISRVIAEENRARDDHKKIVATNLEQLEVKLRREITGGTDKHQSNFREQVAQERQLREKAHAMLTERQSELERKLVGEYSQTALRDISLEMREFVASVCANERAQMQDLLQKEQEFRAQQLEAFSQVLLQERAARENQQESLRVYLTNEKMARQSKDKSLLAELDVQIQRVFREVRNHTHDVQAMGSAQSQQMIVPSRSNSPMARRVASPSPMVPQKQQVLQPQATTFARPLMPATMTPVAGTQVTTVATGTPATVGIGVESSQNYRRIILGDDRSQNEAVQIAVAAVDSNRDGRTNYFVMGEDRNNDGIPDVLQGGSTSSMNGSRINSPTRAPQYVYPTQATDVSPTGARSNSFMTEPGSPMIIGGQEAPYPTTIVATYGSEM